MPPLYVQHTYALLCSHMSMRNCLNVKNKIKWNQDPHVVLENSIKNTECERSKHLLLEFDVYTKIIEATISSDRTELSSSNSRKLTNRLFMVSLTLSLRLLPPFIFHFFIFCMRNPRTNFFLLFMVVWRNHEKHYAKSERTSEVTSGLTWYPKKEQLLVGCVRAWERQRGREIPPWKCVRFENFKMETLRKHIRQQLSPNVHWNKNRLTIAKFMKLKDIQIPFTWLQFAA